MNIQNHRRSAARSLSASAMVLLGACGSDVAGPGGPTGGVVAIEIAPVFGRLVSTGDSLRFTATARYEDGSTQLVEPTWTISDPDIATIEPDGLAIARSEGFVGVGASFDSFAANAVLLVNSDIVPPVLVDVFVDRTSVNIFQRPGVIRLRAEFDDADSGASSSIAVFDGPFGAAISGIVTLERLPPDSSSAPGDSTFTRTAFAGFLQIPANAGVGLWTLAELRVDDRTRNTARWGADDLEDLGLTVEVRAVLTGG